MDPTGQLNVPWQDHHPLGMDGTQVSVLEQHNEDSFNGLVRLPRQSLGTLYQTLCSGQSPGQVPGRVVWK